ncbi:MAG: iron ABC transporter permease [Thermoplasmata archaeon]|nr:iron ABC transporter permease [Thermoplasmata archaeon]
MDEEGLTREGMKAEYHRAIARRLLLLAVSIVGIVLFVGLLSLSNFEGVGLKETYEIIWNHLVGNTYPSRTTEWWADRYIWNTAMPHAIAAILAGASLAVCGTMMQSVMTNPLADPYSTGISSGACLGATAAIVVGISFSTTAGEVGIVTNAFIGALVPALLIIFLSQRIHMTPATLILLGTALSYFFNSMITYIMVTTDAESLKEAYMWQVGSLDGISWESVAIMAAVTVVGSIIVMLMSGKLNVMSLGENSAISLGVDVQRFRVVCLVLMAVMTAAIVSFTGILGFVGLVAPHLVRLVIGSDNRFIAPISMAVGALLLLAADYVAFQLADIPVGVVMSVIGSPVFFALILWQSRKSGAIY